MKNKLFLLVVSLILLTALSFVSCNNDDDTPTNNNDIVGTWIHNLGYGKTNKRIFIEGGDGIYENYDGRKGSFIWKISSPGYVYIKMWFYSNDGHVSKSENNYSYSIKDNGNTLVLNGINYTRAH